MPTSTSPARRPYAKRMPLEERREQLLDAAIRLIARDGYDAVSVDAIAREAGVTRPVVYAAYGGLGTLLHTLLDRSQQRALAQLDEVLSTGTDLADPEALLVDVVRGLIAMVQRDPDLWRPILAAPSGTPREVRERVEADRERIRARIAQLVDLGTAVWGGPVVDSEVVSHLLLATAEHFGRILLDEPQRFEPERIIEAVRLLVVGLRPRRVRGVR
ncbi:TetR/AcrR family transcriptional regulator [Nocardioides terrisoli]|uniref:TetR/AcrR family transcriptional regulator n=1 Tax=Nocardioides terrisoli TaxID=3388267 RepID=UPI00287B9456|nr:helix-turn-helix domain-containing protein [Nocardioides marmorisolisilvae]